MNRILTLLVAALALSGTASAGQSVKDEILVRFDGLQKKLVSLAEAMPESTYGWRPMEGVRSVSEVYMHVAAANYFFSRSLGVEMPEGVDVGGLEKNVTKKADVVARLKDSLGHVRGAIEGVSDAEMGREVDMFGRKSTRRAAMLLILEHASEHLGQSIAYARSNKVVPPWSR